MSINIDGHDCCQTGQPSQDVTDGALTEKVRRSSTVCWSPV
ncbi:pilus biogenesis protein CblD, partial [Escherichia coli]|nr:pilus biogenesis protein CblD [Escherichia coli]